MTPDLYPVYGEYKGSEVDWLGTIPRDWGTKKLKFVTRILKRIAGHEGPDVLSITQQGIKVKDIMSGEGQLAENYSNYQLVYRGDFAMNHMDLLTGYVDIAEFDGVVSPDYRVFRRTSDELDDRYLLLVFQIGYKQRIFFRYGQGVSLLGRWRLPAENFKEFRVPTPPVPEQRAIVAFLDEKCAKVDEAVRIKEEQIALLRERRQILIQQAVTRGLNPEAPMKDSGIDWIGEIPAHWKIWKLAHAFPKFGSGTTPDTGQRSFYDGGIAWLQTGDLTDGDVTRTSKTVSTLAIRSYPTLRVYPSGSVVMAMYGATIGKLGKLKISAATNQACCVLSGSSVLSSRFTFYSLLAMRPYILSQAYGGGQPNISQNTIKAFRIPVAPPSEQLEITKFLNNKCGEIDEAVELKLEQISALKEYKTSLINAAVTGKIKVA